MSQEVHDRLLDLRNRTQAESLVEVIRRSLAVYDALLDEQKDNCTLFSREPDGTEKKIVLM